MIKLSTYGRKGGVGKTTIAANIAHAFAVSGLKTLLIDLDGQNNAARVFGYTKDEREKYKDFYDVMQGKATLEEALINVKSNLDIMFNSNIRLINRELSRNWIGDVVETQTLESFLPSILKGLEDMEYDVVMIDSCPSDTELNAAIAYYADKFLLPVELETFAVEGLGEVFDHLAEYGLDMNKIGIVIPNEYDGRIRESEEYLQMLQELGEATGIQISPPVRKKTILTKGTRHGKSIFEMGSSAYQEIMPVLEMLASLFPTWKEQKELKRG